MNSTKAQTRTVRKYKSEKAMSKGVLAMERIQDYSRDILDEKLGEQEHLDEGWVWRVANDASRKAKGE